jgi:hypothetical protein
MHDKTYRGCSATWPNSRIIIENPMDGKAGWENDLNIAQIMDLTNSQ